MRGSITKTLTKAQYPWLHDTISPGTIVYKFMNATYGAISRDGVAVSLVSEMEYPFFEIPRNSVEWFNEP